MNRKAAAPTAAVRVLTIEGRIRKATPDELVVEVVADLDAAAEKLVAIKRALRKSRLRKA